MKRSFWGRLIALEESESWGGDAEKTGDVERDGERWLEGGRTGLELCAPCRAGAIRT